MVIKTGGFMKRISAFIFILAMLFSVFAFSFVSADINPEKSPLIQASPESFMAYGFEYADENESPPFHRLNAIIDFEFIHGTESHGQYKVEFPEESIYGPAVHILDLYLTYDHDLLEGNQYTSFISGYFTYYWEHSGEINEYLGTVAGGLREIDLNILGLSAEYQYTNALALDLIVNGGAWDWTIFLEVPGEETAYYVTGYLGDDVQDYHYESPHVPTPSKQADVAAGVGLSTAGIALANALTKTSVFGSVSFNATAAPPVPTPAPAASATQSSATSQSSGFFNTIWDFLKRLFEHLRDMLTDEGRSYASGRLAETLGEIEADDITGGDSE
jgi:hypothetical protein